MPHAATFVPAPDELVLQHLAVEVGRLIIVAAARRPEALCPVCGAATRRVHGRYERCLADLPWHGLAVTLRVQVRRFVCEAPACPRRIFCERFPATAAVFARRTTRLHDALAVIGLALGGEAGARLAHALGMGTGASADTVLRVLGAPRAPAEHPPSESPVRVLGVDDWAWRKGQSYGTILVDLERHRVLELLPDREPSTLVAWLTAHAGIEIISRDRASAYAEAATRGAPDAVQVADRFHLLRNLTDAVQQTLERHQRAVRTVAPLERSVPAPSKRGGAVSRSAAEPRASERARAAHRDRRLACYEQVVALSRKGLSKLAISRQTGVSRATVLRWLRADGFPERRPAAPRRTAVDAHGAHLRQRWAEGCHNATQLWRELRAQHGFRGGRSAVRDWIARHVRGHAPRTPDAALPCAAHPSPRRAAWLLTKAAETLTDPERAYVDAVCTACPALATVRMLTADFQRMLATKT